MEKLPRKMDNHKLSKRNKADYRQEMKALGVDKNFMKYLIADCLTIPFDLYANPALPPSEANKLREASFKKMKRRLIKQYGDKWKERWEKNKRLMKNSKKTKYVQNPFGFEPKNTPTMRNPKPTKPSQDRILGFIWMAKTYFERLTKAKMGKPRPCWDLIAELLEFFPVKNETSGKDVASWWQKRKKDFEPWDGDTFLESHLAFYQRNKLELDTQCREWLGKCVEWLKKVEEPEKGFQKTKEGYREFSKE